MFFFFFSSRRRHTRFSRDWSSDVCSSDLVAPVTASGFGCGSTIWPKDDTVREVETITPEGEVVVLPKAEDVAARSDCHQKRRTQTTVALSVGVAGLIGVFWSVVAAPETRRRRS